MLMLGSWPFGRGAVNIEIGIRPPTNAQRDARMYVAPIQQEQQQTQRQGDVVVQGNRFLLGFRLGPVSIGNR